MGYILKTIEEGKDIYKLFYSEPEYGCYSDNIMLVSRKEYDDHYSKLQDADYVFLNGWHDTSSELHSKESLGIDITDSFFLDCILQGKTIDYNNAYNFELS